MRSQIWMSTISGGTRPLPQLLCTSGSLDNGSAFSQKTFILTPSNEKYLIISQRDHGDGSFVKPLESTMALGSDLLVINLLFSCVQSYLCCFEWQTLWGKWITAEGAAICQHNNSAPNPHTISFSWLKAAQLSFADRDQLLLCHKKKKEKEEEATTKKPNTKKLRKRWSKHAEWKYLNVF